MAIYDFSKSVQGELKISSSEQKETSILLEGDAPSEPAPRQRDQLFSAVATRLFFLLLLAADLLWICYAAVQLCISLIGFSVTGERWELLSG